MFRDPLPPPGEAASAASAALLARIGQAIQAAGGWIGFDRYMQLALYEPGLGYYSGGAHKFGAAGDFVTAPVISPLFADCVAVQCVQWFAQVPARIVEFGAGDGTLAAQLLGALDAAGIGELRYDIVELSAELAQRQRERIAAQYPSLLPRVRWLDRLPDTLSGVVLGNELLDAMPVRLFVVQHERLDERGVVDAAPPGGPPALRLADRPADAVFAAQVRAALADAGWPGEALAPGYASEYAAQARAWVASIAQRLDRGVALLFDYGFPAAEYYHPQRATGTLMCHYRHRAHGDPFHLPGLQDLTAHVDFDAVAHAAGTAGTTLLGYSSQASFLLNCGLLEHLARRRQPGDALADARANHAVQQLVSEAEMGELFKVIAFGRGVDDHAIGFARGDRRHRLAAAGADA